MASENSQKLSAKARNLSRIAGQTGTAHDEAKAAQAHRVAAQSLSGEAHPKDVKAFAEHNAMAARHENAAASLRTKEANAGARSALQKWAESKRGAAKAVDPEHPAERQKRYTGTDAHSLSRNAERASENTYGPGNGTAPMHERAADAHEAAAKAMRGIGDHATAKEHDREAAKHREKAAAAGGGDDRPRDDHGRFASK